MVSQPPKHTHTHTSTQGCEGAAQGNTHTRERWGKPSMKHFHRGMSLVEHKDLVGVYGEGDRGANENLGIT